MILQTIFTAFLLNILCKNSTTLAAEVDTPTISSWSNYASTDLPRIDSNVGEAILTGSSITYIVGSQKYRASTLTLETVIDPRDNDVLWVLKTKTDIKIMGYNPKQRDSNFPRRRKGTGVESPCYMLDDNALNDLPPNFVHFYVQEGSPNRPSGFYSLTDITDDRDDEMYKCHALTRGAMVSCDLFSLFSFISSETATLFDY